MKDIPRNSGQEPPGRFRRRVSVSESIGSSPTTILINMMIEGIAALILFFGILYLLRFLFMFRDRIQELHFKVFIIAIVFFSAAWGTHIAFKLRSHYLNYRKASAGKKRKERTDNPET